jgi:hypothetical protein
MALPVLPQTTNYAPVTVALIANAAVAIALAVLKQRYDVDFSGQEANLQVLATAFGYMVTKKDIA